MAKTRIWRLISTPLPREDGEIWRKQGISSLRLIFGAFHSWDVLGEWSFLRICFTLESIWLEKVFLCICY